MKLLIVGGAGYVGQIVCPVIAQEHDCTYFDLQPVSGAEDRTVIADVNDDDAVKNAVQDCEGVLYMPLGVGREGGESCNQIDPAFDVNVKGLFRFVSFSLHSGANWFCYVSSMSVYECMHSPHHMSINERVGSDSWGPYGMSKRVGEFLCESMWRMFPHTAVLSLRLMLPRNEEDWPKTKKAMNDYPEKYWRSFPLGPESTRQLFLAALRCKKPGCHIINLTGDAEHKHFDVSLARQLLAWEPQSD